MRQVKLCFQKGESCGGNPVSDIVEAVIVGDMICTLGGYGGKEQLTKLGSFTGASWSDEWPPSRALCSRCQRSQFRSRQLRPDARPQSHE